VCVCGWRKKWTGQKNNPGVWSKATLPMITVADLGGAPPFPPSLVLNDRDALIEQSVSQSVTLIKQSQCLLGSVVYL